MATINAQVISPCPGCAHQPICNRTARVVALGQSAEVGLGSMPAGLTVAVRAEVQCDAFLKPTRRSPTPVAQGQDEAQPVEAKPKRQISPEHLAALQAGRERHLAAIASEPAVNE